MYAWWECYASKFKAMVSTPKESHSFSGPQVIPYLSWLQKEPKQKAYGWVRLSVTSVSTINELCWCLYVKATSRWVKEPWESLWPPFTVRTKTASSAVSVISDYLLRSFDPFHMHSTHQNPRGPHPYCFSIPSGPKLHWRKIFRTKVLQGVTPGDC